MNQDHDLDAAALDTALDAALEPADEEVAAVTAEVVAMTTVYRDLHRQSDTKAGQCLTVVGLVLAAAAAVVPRMDGVALVLAAIAVIAAVLSGVMFGFALKPHRQNRELIERSSMLYAAVRRIRDPRFNLEFELRDLVNEVNFVSAKHLLIRYGMGMLGITFLAAVAAAVAAVVSAMV
ncbi:hypothetical protein [Glycomyces albidus]|jgi:hypothetical protein|uniref:Pycsar effector protein domain-containing protein n=1 Tax=Glycomyces albidus TaxID=2656774 RepID=A0A6L5G509_9ACTN|nr:hypothetical protein [Glycomyces albidus]MQM24733.1 hypothetical protein [Glycomyces albidus]